MKNLILSTLLCVFAIGIASNVSAQKGVDAPAQLEAIDDRTEAVNKRVEMLNKRIENGYAKLDEMKAAGKIDQAEYDARAARLEEARAKVTSLGKKSDRATERIKKTGKPEWVEKRKAEKEAAKASAKAERETIKADAKADREQMKANKADKKAQIQAEKEAAKANAKADKAAVKAEKAELKYQEKLEKQELKATEKVKKGKDKANGQLNANPKGKGKMKGKKK